MAVCVGCGLEVVNGVLQVNVCGAAGVGTTTGGLACDPATEAGCLKVVLNDSHAGCGLNATAGGQLEFDPCLNGGILCGATDDDPEDNCAYVNVAGQGGGPCVDINTVRGTPIVPPLCGDQPFGPPTTTVQSPNCNGLVRTCDGLWSPPSLPTLNFSCGQLSNYGGTINGNYSQPLGDQAGLVAGSADGFPPHATDVAYGLAGNRVIIINAFDNDDCVPIDAMSFTIFNIAFEIRAGELWRFALHERICLEPTPADVITTGCSNGWSLQALEYVDARNETVNTFVTVGINDNSTWRFGKCDAGRMEAMITFNRLVGGPTANADNRVIYTDFQYRNMGHGYHHQLPQFCGFKSTATADGGEFPGG